MGAAGVAVLGELPQAGEESAMQRGRGEADAREDSHAGTVEVGPAVG